MIEQVQHAGEHLLPGHIGRFFVVISFVAALLATVSYFSATRAKDHFLQYSWNRIGRWSFLVHGVAVIGIVCVLFYLIANHFFEYHYVWKHSSKSLPSQYLLSCFWEGQEGSFLLWTFWHIVLGGILIFTAKKWENPVMTVIAATQVVLASMLLGIHVLEVKIGSNPFILMRQAMDAPIFARENYMNFISDGTGLNPLLQNYWMTIHPPTLFLGFAATIVPFAFAFAGLWTQDFKGWVNQALPWTLFAAMILGTGVLMGAAWAYEALSFGGFWAWDPVENASLVPLLTLIGGLHTLVVFRHTGHGLKATKIFFILTFLLVLYSTFLTRSGVLGDTSVHSFTAMGMEKQLIAFIFIFLIPSVYLLIRRWKRIPTQEKEESTSSREFWMFIGSLVLLLSAIQITFTTSIPVYNELFGTDIAPPTDPIQHYNKIQVWVAIIVSIMTAFGQFLRYRRSDIRTFFVQTGTLLAISLVLSLGAAYALDILVLHYTLMLFAGIFAVIANVSYLLVKLKGNLRMAGASFAHVGFGLIMLGVLISNYNQQVISINRQGIDFGDEMSEKQKRENILLWQDTPKPMGNYIVTYQGDTTVGANTYYNVKYERMNQQGEKVEEFVLRPYAQINPRMGITASPATRNYLTQDVYTHVSSVPKDEEEDKEKKEYETQTIAVGDTIWTSNKFVVLEEMNPYPEHPDYEKQKGDIAVGAKLTIGGIEGKTQHAEPVYVIRDKRANYYDDEVPGLGMKFRLMEIKPQEEKMVIGYIEDKDDRNFIIMKAIIFPYMNVLWAGCIIMVLGFVISIVRRRQENKRLAKSKKKRETSETLAA